MFDLQISIPVPFALFIIVIALASAGCLLGREPKDKQFWLLIGFTELGFALVCFLFMPFASFELAPTGTLIFVILSFGLACISSLFLIRRAA